MSVDSCADDQGVFEVGSRYWDTEARAAVRERFGGLVDVRPYDQFFPSPRM